MKYNVTQLEENNEPVNSVLGNYFIELEPGNYQAEEASNMSDAQPDLLRFSQADEIDCNIVNLAIEQIRVQQLAISGLCFFMALRCQKGQGPAMS